MESNLLIPVILRLSLFIVIPVIHWSFHRLIEHGIARAERLHAFESFAKRIRFLPDLLMIGALIAFHFVESQTES